ncbi:MAG: hypothetical protein H3C47_13260 [Candidatus Cloacimonetes bacterium]|nr:hypothetical protein [Candidatus Cloacimonadota bacterium]
MKIELNNIQDAYLYLKSYAYHENLNLFLKNRVAQFETKHLTQPLIDKAFSNVMSVVNDEDFKSDKNFNTWINSIGFHLLPKQFESADHKTQNQDAGLFISNVRSCSKYKVRGVNYFIKASVELHILEILWCLYAAPALESSMSKDSYGNRMRSSAIGYAKSKNSYSGKEVFKRYIDQYNQWRDQAVRIATELSNNGCDVALLSLDFKAYFYYVDLQFGQIATEVSQYFQNDEQHCTLALRLTKILEAIFLHYKRIILPSLKNTHSECENKLGLPIGLASSSIISNWYLSKFDSLIDDKARPEYYGRYVDDIIMVFKQPKFDQQNPIESFVINYLTSILHKSEDNKGLYTVKVGENHLPIQQNKLILQFYDREHSRAGLEVFKQELEERSSAFKFLPSEHIDKELDRFAYDILYEGSANKLRNIVGLAENETELAKYLSSHITAHRLCKLDKNSSVLPQLKRFLKGQNALQFFRLWEKVYQYALVIKNKSFLSSFCKSIKLEIDKIDDAIIDSPSEICDSPAAKVKIDLLHYNNLALSLTLGLTGIEQIDELRFPTDEEKSSAKELSFQFRTSNLIRHHLVAWPLANFSDYDGDLTSDVGINSNSKIKINKFKVEFSPRFIHYDEFQIFKIIEYLEPERNLNDWLTQSQTEYKKMYFHLPVTITSESESTPPNLVKSKIVVGDNHLQKEVKLAIANIVVEEENIKSALRKDQTPNIDFSRQENLYNTLNAALREKADILVMPEVAIPVSWFPFMVSFARRHQIGLVFGLEHWVVNNRAYNLIIEALPFKISNEYKSCIVLARVKNHYAPMEKNLLEKLRLYPAGNDSQNKAYYHKVSWRGFTFATYNCFELSDITHRVIFKSEIDLLFACVWNKDTNYYQHILESTVRDLHCYTVQANTSQYGGSCVLRPTSTENKTMLYIKGGENPCVLTTKIDIGALREFQFKSVPDDKDQFKHLPPGFDSDSVPSR